MSIEKLEHLSLLEISGDDALTFLQGQLTNDVNLAKDAWQYSGYCNPKGRLLALFKLWRHEGSVYALIDNSLVDAITKRLTMYVMRSKVKITLSEHKCFAVLGGLNELEKITDLNISAINSINNRHDVFSDGNEHILAHGGRYLCITNNTKADTQTANSRSEWHNQDITEGLPEVTASSSELFIPQMLNLDILNGVNFKKGCYTGQEIVARMHYLGKSKQRMFVCDVNGPISGLTEGSKIYSDNSLEKSVGNLVSINDIKALAVLRIEDDMTGSFSLNENTTLSLAAKQPYSIEIN